MDPLTQLLMQRQMDQPPQPSPVPQLPVVPPSGGGAHIPSEGQRFLTSQAMMNAVRNGQSPLLTQIASTPK